MAIRVKTVWFKKAEGQRSADEVGSVLASTIWRLSDNTVTGLSKADYDIITPERGVRILGEMAAFLLHATDRTVHGRIADDERARLMQATGSRLADVMTENIRAMVGNDGFDYRANFIEMLNRRGAEYAEFAIDPAKPSFQVLRFLALAIRELATDADRHWVADQVMEILAPEALGTLKKTIDGFYPARELAA
jgi:hypothetical protein